MRTLEALFVAALLLPFPLAPPLPARIADCNQNRVADEADIAGGTSGDCNGNGIPDECDLRVRELLFRPGGSLALGGFQTSFELADLNGDGAPDAALPTSPEEGPIPGLVSVLLNDGSGELLLPGLYPAGQNPSSTRAADLDGDGFLDLVVPCKDAQAISALRSRGDGRFYAVAPLRLFRPKLGWDASVAALDLDEDGRADLAMNEPWTGQVLFFLNTSPPPRSLDLDRDGVPDECRRTRFRRGDTDGSGAVELADAVLVLEMLFRAGLEPACREAADADNDGSLALTDAVYLVAYLFLGGPPPAPPGPPPAPCGLDPDPPGGPGDLGCASYGGC
jgi:hypothetical protein